MKTEVVLDVVDVKECQVKEVYVTRVDPGSASFRLDVRGNSQGLRQTIALGNMLAVAPVNTTPGTGGSGDVSNPPIPVPGMNPDVAGGTVPPATEFHYRMLP